MNSTLCNLIHINVTWLEQAAGILAYVDDAIFTTTPAGLAPHKAGSHLRHILEFYECFLEGVATGLVDYDARKRDLSIETSRASAFARILEVRSRLKALPMTDAAIRVRVEDSDSIGSGNDLLISSVGRELQTLSSHTIHHFALIAMTLRAHGLRVDPRFGMAPSTLRHQERQQQIAEAA